MRVALRTTSGILQRMNQSWTRQFLYPFLTDRLSQPFLRGSILWPSNLSPILQPFRDQEFRIYLQFILQKTAPSVSLQGFYNLYCTSSTWLHFLLSSLKKDMHTEMKAVIHSIKVHVGRWITWLLFSAWLFLLESGKWMWHPVSSITFLILLPPLPITWECSVCETSIFKVTRLLYMETMYYCSTWKQLIIS